MSVCVLYSMFYRLLLNMAQFPAFLEIWRFVSFLKFLPGFRVQATFWHFRPFFIILPQLTVPLLLLSRFSRSGPPFRSQTNFKPHNTDFRPLRSFRAVSGFSPQTACCRSAQRATRYPAPFNAFFLKPAYHQICDSLTTAVTSIRLSEFFRFINF
jgi:hypothetical protein